MINVLDMSNDKKNKDINYYNKYDKPFTVPVRQRKRAGEVLKSTDWLQMVSFAPKRLSSIQSRKGALPLLLRFPGHASSQIRTPPYDFTYS